MPTILMFVPPTCFTDYFKPIFSVHSPYTRESLDENLFVNPVQTTQYGICSLFLHRYHTLEFILDFITN